MLLFKKRNLILISCLVFALCQSQTKADELLSSASQRSKSSSKLLDKLQPLPVQEDTRSVPKPKEPITVYEDEEEEEESASKDGHAMIYLTIATPHGHGPEYKVEAYPYPPKPPKTEDYAPLPTKEKEIREFLINAGYNNRREDDSPFPIGGWRFKYAISKAQRKANLSVPHSIFEYRGWTSNMVPFVKDEITKINDFEELRKRKWNNYKTFYQDNYKLLQSKAARFGMEKAYFRPLPKEKNKLGSNFGVVLPPGKWWILAKKKAKGLTTYWVKEMDLKDKDRIVLVFNEGNASVLTGGW